MFCSKRNKYTKCQKEKLQNRQSSPTKKIRVTFAVFLNMIKYCIDLIHNKNSGVTPLDFLNTVMSIQKVKRKRGGGLYISDTME